MYTEITLAQMDEVLKAFDKVIIPNTKEIVYEIGYKDDPKLVNIKLRVYSSICQGVSRKCGRDAIRIVLFDTKLNKCIGKATRTYREENWGVNLIRKARELYKTVKHLECPFCGYYMVVRKSKNGEFLGCSNYPNCKHTKNL